jgi:hypothetical protein
MEFKILFFRQARLMLMRAVRSTFSLNLTIDITSAAEG